MASWKRDNRTGTITKLKGKRRKPFIAYGPYHKVNGIPQRDYIGTFKTYSEAENALIRATRGATMRLNENTTMDELFEILYAKKEKKNMTESSLKAVKTNYNHIKSLGNYKFMELSTYHFQSVLDELIEQGSSFSKVSKIKSTIKQLYDVAIENKILTVNYAQFLDISEAKEGKVYPFPEEDIETLFANDNDRIAKASLILAYTGLRISSFLSLSKFKNLNLNEGYIQAGNKTKAGKNRIIPIHYKIRPYIDYFFYEFPDCDLLFSRNGEEVTPDYYRKYYHNPLIKRLDLFPYTPHSFRHTFFSKARQAKLQDKFLELVGGHTNATFSDERYVDFPPEYLAQEMNKIC